MAENRFHGMLYAYTLGCLNNNDCLRLKNYMESADDFPNLELGEYQNLVALIPSILEIEAPPKSVKEAIARNLYTIKDQEKEQRRKILHPAVEAAPEFQEEEHEAALEEEGVNEVPENIPGDLLTEEPKLTTAEEYLKKYNIDESADIEEDETAEIKAPEIPAPKERKRIKTSTEEVLQDILYDQETTPPSAPSEIPPVQPPGEITPVEPAEEITPVKPGEEITPIRPGEEITPPQPSEEPEETPEEVPPPEEIPEEPEEPEKPSELEEHLEQIPEEIESEVDEEEEVEEVSAESKAEPVTKQPAEIKSKTQTPVTDETKPKRSLGDFLADAEIKPEEVIGSIEFEDYFAEAHKAEVKKTAAVRERPAPQKMEREVRPVTERLSEPRPRPSYSSSRSYSGGGAAGKIFYVLLILIILAGSYYYFSDDLNKYMAESEEMQAQIDSLTSTVASQRDITSMLSLRDSRIINLSGGRGHGKVIYSPGLERGYISVTGLGDLKENKFYYLWITAGGRNYVAARLTHTQVTETFVPFSVHKVSLSQSLRIFLTEEPLGGSQTPSSVVLLSGSN